MACIYYFAYFIIYSFIGWVYESTLCSITGRKPVNRGFLTGPVCPIYGFGAILVILALGQSELDILPLFLSGGVLTCTLEYFTSWAMERLFSARWWDYSQMRFNLNGRVCLLGFVAFGAFSVVLIRFIHPRITALVGMIPEIVLTALCGMAAVLFLGDIVVTVRHVLRVSRRLKELQAALDGALEAAAERREQWYHTQQKRLDEAREAIDEARAKLREQGEAAYERTLLAAAERREQWYRSQQKRLDEAKEAIDEARARLREQGEAAFERTLEAAASRRDQWLRSQQKRLDDAREAIDEALAHRHGQDEDAGHSEQTERLGELLSLFERPGFQDRRLLNAFPKLSSRQTSDALAQLKRRIAELKEQNRRSRKK